MEQNKKIAKELFRLASQLMNDNPVEIMIQTENSAFQDGNRQFELARILRKLADDIENGNKVKSLMDINGNKVGEVKGI